LGNPPNRGTKAATETGDVSRPEILPGATQDFGRELKVTTSAKLPAGVTTPRHAAGRTHRGSKRDICGPAYGEKRPR